MPDTVAPNLVAAVSEARQWDRLMQLGQLGGFTDPDGHEGVNRAWDYGRGDRPESLSSLRVSLALDPRFQVLVVHGLYDLVTPYFSSKLLLDQLPPIGPPERVGLRAYAGGHMFYSIDASRAAFTADGRRAIEAASR